MTHVVLEITDDELKQQLEEHFNINDPSVDFIDRVIEQLHTNVIDALPEEITIMLCTAIEDVLNEGVK